MNFELKFKSIATRWFFSIFLIVAIASLVFAIAFSTNYSTLYVERIETLAREYSRDFSALSTCDRESFENTARMMAEDFEQKDRLEIQVLDSDGKMLVSTTGFQLKDEPMPDYKSALSADSGKGTYKGKNTSGEQILAGTQLIYAENGELLGAYRWVTSMKAAQRHIALIVLLMMLVFIGILAISALSGIFFIKSIVRPIRDVSNAARKIAAGDFNAKIEFKKNDEIGELCDTINYMASELASADAMKNDFISSVSHELRTPLTAIRGWGETAKMSIGYDDALVERGLDVVLSESERLSGLVEDLLDFSRMQNGKLTVNAPQPIDISELLGASAGMYTELARQQGIEVSYTPPAEPAVVLGDRDRLKQVFINVIDNAVKYSEKGGLVLVVQSREEGCVRVQIKDTGVGIPAQDIDRVKEKFFKSNKTVRGSGIGLAVADEIIKQHKGLLFIESTEGVGTTVTIVLPLYVEEPSELPAAEPQPVGETETEMLQPLPETQEIPEIKEIENG